MTTIDIRDVPGTNCYLDEASCDCVRELVFKAPLADVHFIGSGNYHYLSYFFLGRVKSPFYLVLFDNHPDCQAPAFGDILSCGGWVKKAILDYPMLQGVFIVGASPEHVKEEEPFPERVTIISDIKTLPGMLEEAFSCGLVDGKSDITGIYISIDKDVLSEEFALTDWDQGNMTIEGLCETLGLVCEIAKCNEAEIVGVDICGDSKSEPNGPDHPVNHNSNLLILETISKIF